MKPAQLAEAPSNWDTVKTSLKAFGSRVGNSAVAAAGSYVGAGYGARGKLSVRITADEMMQKWLVIQAGTREPATRTALYNFIQRNCSNPAVSDARVREIVGIAPAETQPEVESAPTDTPYDPHVATEIDILFHTIFNAIKRRKAAGGQTP